jgi:hypothetical protein
MFLVDAMFNSINIISAQKVLIYCNTWTETLYIPHSTKGATNDVTVSSTIGTYNTNCYFYRMV